MTSTNLSPRQQELIDDMKIGDCELFVMFHVSPNHAECGDKCTFYRDDNLICDVSMATFNALIKRDLLVYHSERNERKRYVLAEKPEAAHD